MLRLPGVGADRKILETIEQIILKEAKRLGIDVYRIILFGSRARSDAREDSGYNVLVIVSDDTSN